MALRDGLAATIAYFRDLLSGVFGERATGFQYRQKG